MPEQAACQEVWFGSMLARVSCAWIPHNPRTALRNTSDSVSKPSWIACASIGTEREKLGHV
eukprot:5192662-Amphidinium_carterae.1